MKLRTVLERAPMWYKSGRCFYLRSAPGRGKTTTVERMPALLEAYYNKQTGAHDVDPTPRKKFGVVTINGASLTPMDVLGFGLPKHTETHSLMVFSRPFFWVTNEGKFLEEYDGGIIFIDEADKADVDIKKVIGEGALTGRFGPHKLPPGWVVWMAGNRAEHDRSGSTKELDHMINRIFWIDISDDPVSWQEYAEETGVSPVTISFAMNNPQIVWADKLPDKQGPYCTPRSLCMLDNYMQVLEKHLGHVPDDDTTLEEASAIIGMEAASQYFVTVRLSREMPTYEDMVANPTTCKCPSKVDAQMLVCYTLASRVNEEDAGQVIKYIERMPKDFAATFARAAIKRDPMLVATPAFNKWAMNNSALLTLINNSKR